MNQQSIAASERTYRVLFDRHPTPLWVYCEKSHRILKVNDAAIAAYGYSREEFLRLRIEDLRPASELARLQEHYRTADRDQLYFGTWTHRRKDGSTLEVTIHSHGVEIDDQSARLVIAADVTEQRRAQRALLESEARLRALNQQLEDRIFVRTEELLLARERAEKADRVKSMFLATVSHELRTPLNSIIGFSDILLQGLAGPLTDEQQKQLGIVHQSGKHLLELISDFLDISKIEAGALTLQSVPIDLRALLTRDLGMHESAARDRGLGFVFTDESPSDPCHTFADPKRVRQVVDNLLSNAIKFTDAGTVRLILSDDGPQVRIAIEDSGIGIAPDQLQRLFEPFARVEAPSERTRDGTGLGLAIAKHLAEAMGGTIGVASVPGAGSHFWFTLPRSE